MLRVADPAASLALAGRHGAAVKPVPALSDAQVADARVAHMYESKEGGRRTMDPYLPEMQYKGPGVPPSAYTVGELDFFLSQTDEEEEEEGSDEEEEMDGEWEREEAIIKELTRVVAALAGRARATRAARAAAEAAYTPPAWMAALAQHAATLGSWSALVRALTQRGCVACGAVTRWIAWVPADDTEAHGRIADAAQAAAAAVEAGGAQTASSQAAAPAPTAGPARCCAGCALPCGVAALSRCVLLNASFFDAPAAADAAVELDAASFGDNARAASAALQAAVDACLEGGTVKLRGAWELSAPLQTQGRKALRLLGVPPPVVGAAAYIPAHPLLAPDAPGGAIREASYAQLEVPRRVLLDAEEEAADDARVGCPAARLHCEEHPLNVCAPLWLEGLALSTGNRETYGKYGWPHEVDDDIMGYGIQICDGVCVRRRQHGAGADPAVAPLVLRRCWVTAYSGTGVVLDSGAHAALLGCCVSNCLGAGVACNSGSTLRMRGCHVVSNNADVCGGGRAEDAAALADANVFTENWPVPGTIDVFKFPPDRAVNAMGNPRITPATELAPWSPLFTAEVPSSDGGERQPPATFANVQDVALLSA